MKTLDINDTSAALSLLLDELDNAGRAFETVRDHIQEAINQLCVIERQMEEESE